MKVVEVKHPLVKHKIGLMREGDISTKRFRELAKEVGSLLTYEATSDFETEKVTIDGWNGPVEVDQIKGKKATVVPILRAGLGMMDGVLEHMPSARVSVVGIYRDLERANWRTVVAIQPNRTQTLALRVGELGITATATVQP